MKYLLLAFAALAALAAGGAGGYLFLKQPAEAAIGPDGVHRHAGDLPLAPQGTGIYVEMDSLILPIVDEHGVNQVITMVIVIEVTSDDAAERIASVKPRLKDAYIQDMYGVLNRHMALRNGVLQVGMIKERLVRVSNQVMREDIVTDVLVQVVQQRPI